MRGNIFWLIFKLNGYGDNLFIIKVRYGKIFRYVERY